MTQDLKPDEKIDSSDEQTVNNTGQKEIPKGDKVVRPDPTRYGDWEKGGKCIDF